MVPKLTRLAGIRKLMVSKSPGAEPSTSGPFSRFACDPAQRGYYRPVVQTMDQSVWARNVVLPNY